MRVYKTLEDYTMYYLMKMTDGNAVFLIPSDENKHMAESMQPVAVIYFVMSYDALGIATDSELSVIDDEPTEVTSLDNFDSQIKAILFDFDEDLVNTIGDIIDVGEDETFMLYTSEIELEHASVIYIYEDFLSASILFHAEFNGYPDPAHALKAYRELVIKVESLTLSCCELTIGEESVTGNAYRQSFHVINHPEIEAYENLILAVHIEQHEAFDKHGQLVSDWRPTLDIYFNE